MNNVQKVAKPVLSYVKYHFTIALAGHSRLMGFGLDITECKYYQDALESVSRWKFAFVSTIGYELRITPLK